MEDVTITRSFSRKSLSLHIESDGSILVKAPFFITKGTIHAFIKKHEAWITKKQLALRERSIEKASDNYLYLGKVYELVVRSNQKNIIELEDKLYIGSANKKLASTYLTSWYKQQARKLIVERAQRYAKITGVTYRSIKITTATTRWGSCSSQKTLNFNWKLIMAPIEVLDYVVAHELAHLSEMNHSRAFWETVRKMYPLYREYRTWLKRYGHSLTVE
ncbi:MAG: SprT family zinc-dependent metalloprotease [Patescibacteria group bacterium]